MLTTNVFLGVAGWPVTSMRSRFHQSSAGIPRAVEDVGGLQDSRSPPGLFDCETDQPSIRKKNSGEQHELVTYRAVARTVCSANMLSVNVSVWSGMMYSSGLAPVYMTTCCFMCTCVDCFPSVDVCHAFSTNHVFVGHCFNGFSN